MTWVVGTATPFGHALVASDIRVTWPGGITHDCLQKVYRLGDFVIGGFAGSVQIGLAMVDFLQRQFAAADPGGGWDLEVISQTWLPRVLRHRFKLWPKELRASRCQLLLAAAHPTANMGDLPVPRTVVRVFHSPRFLAEEVRTTEAGSIGSGVTAYAEAIRGLTSSFPFHQASLAGAETQAGILAQSLYSAVRRTPTQGVSPLFHAAMVTRGRIVIVPHEVDVFEKDGTRRPEIRLPHVATNRETFVQFSRDRGLSAESSLC